MGETVIVSVCASAHMPVHVLLMNLMEIGPLKTLSLFCSGGQLMPTQTKTEVPQPVFLSLIIVRTTAAALPASVCKNPSHCIVLQRRQFTMMGDLKLRKKEANTRRRWKEAHFILAEKG